MKKRYAYQDENYSPRSTLTLYIKTYVKVTALFTKFNNTNPIQRSLCKDHCISFTSEHTLGEIWAKRREILLISVNRPTDHYGGVTAEKSPNKYCCFGGYGGWRWVGLNTIIELALKYYIHHALLKILYLQHHWITEQADPNKIDC